MKKAGLLFVPSPGIGHLRPTVEMAKLIVDRYDHVSITVLIINLPFDSMLPRYTQSLAAGDPHPRLRFLAPSPPEEEKPDGSRNFLTALIDAHAPLVRRAAAELAASETGLAGFVVGMFCTALVDVADGLGVPSYVFFASSAAFLGLMLHVQRLRDEEGRDVTELKGSEAELVVSSCVNPVPARVLPSPMLDRDWCGVLVQHARRMRGAEGILVNTFEELESHAVGSFSRGVPPVYPVGPLLDLTAEISNSLCGAHEESEIVTWLDGQPRSSVVFLCFGSMGSFGGDQVREIALALERSGHRFMWSLREPPPVGKIGLPTDYANPGEALPEGFLGRTAGVGRVIGWAPQVTILAHEAVGGFVSHCGWNSALESVWFGVPVATWPMYSEQQFNAFALERELGLAVEIRSDYRRDFKSGSDVVVGSEEIERGIRGVMEQGSQVRKRVKEMSECAKKALIEGGSSFSAVDRWMCNVMDNMQ